VETSDSEAALAHRQSVVEAGQNAPRALSTGSPAVSQLPKIPDADIFCFDSKRQAANNIKEKMQ
jgi:hypothetical protein